jgi:predicted nuclease of predicted toxin-antitoxin system
MARLYANENFPLQVVEALRNLGHDVLTVREAGFDNQRIPDTEVLAFAGRENRILLTLNRRDFIRLHQQDSHHSRIIDCTEDADTDRQAQHIHTALVSNHDIANHLVCVRRTLS